MVAKSAKISSSTNITMAVVVSLLGAIGAAGLAYGMFSGRTDQRITATEIAITELQARQSTVDEIKIDLAVMKAEMRDIGKGVDRLLADKKR